MITKIDRIRKAEKLIKKIEKEEQSIFKACLKNSARIVDLHEIRHVLAIERKKLKEIKTQSPNHEVRDAIIRKQVNVYVGS